MPPAFQRLAWTAALAWALLLAGCPEASQLAQPPPDGPINWEAFDGPGKDAVYAVQVFVLPDTRSATVRQVPH